MPLSPRHLIGKVPQGLCIHVYLGRKLYTLWSQVFATLSSVSHLNACLPRPWTLHSVIMATTSLRLKL